MYRKTEDGCSTVYSVLLQAPMISLNCAIVSESYYKIGVGGKDGRGPG